LGRTLHVRYGSLEAQTLWTSYVGDSWTIPPDARIEMIFQQHLLERLDKDKAIHLLQSLKDVSDRLEYRSPFDYAKRGSFRVTDFDFDPSFGESAAEYRAEVLTGTYKKHPLKSLPRRRSSFPTKTVPWKRIM